MITFQKDMEYPTQVYMGRVQKVMKLAMKSYLICSISIKVHKGQWADILPSDSPELIIALIIECLKDTIPTYNS